MTNVYINPKWVICDFLRSKITDPRNTRIYSHKELDFIADSGQTEFSLSFSSGKGLSHIKRVLVDGVEKKKWMFYYVNFRDNKIVFFEEFSGGEEVKIELYESSTNWIFWDTLEGKLKPEQFPRITVLIAAGSGDRLGNYGAPVESTFNVQFDVYAKEKASNQVFKIDGKNYTGEELAERLAYDIQSAFEDFEDDLHPILYDYTPSQFPPRNVPFDDNLQCHRKIVECELSGIKIGRL